MILDDISLAFEQYRRDTGAAPTHLYIASSDRPQLWREMEEIGEHDPSRLFGMRVVYNGHLAPHVFYMATP